MWENLPAKQKEDYKRLILAFASLTEMFAQKSSEDSDPVPIINSKFQERSFQKSFGAVGEDIGNTSYDASLQCDGIKYLVGIKTFGFSSGDQKIAQFKAKHADWAQMIDMIEKNAKSVNDKENIDILNHQLYMELAKEIARIRNARIDSSHASIKGFLINENEEKVFSVYHVLMPSNKNCEAKIYVGETSYDKIDIDNIEVMGCTGKNNPTNFRFRDGNHVYKYTSADSQLHMNFNNANIVCDEWNVKYANDAYSIFGKLADMILPKTTSLGIAEESAEYYTSKRKFEKPIETYCWTIWNKNGEVELYSGFNSFYGIGSKMSKTQRLKKIQSIIEKYKAHISDKILQKLFESLNSFLLDSANTLEEKQLKVCLRDYILELVNSTKNEKLKSDIIKLVYRPMDEMYIPIPNSVQFHKEHPKFFGDNLGSLMPGTSKLALPKEQRTFNLVFEPSGDSLPVYITQDGGKAIESTEKQTYLGEWILHGVFQLDEYEPLDSKKLKELGINGLKFSKYNGSSDIHLEFIWIDEKNPPEGYIKK